MNSRVRILSLLTFFVVPMLQGEAQQNAAGETAAAPWYLNNVLSTSLETPAAALRVSLEETVEVRGTIIDVDGSPAVGAEVWAASVFAAPPARERVFTDAQGRFVLHLKPLADEHERWRLSAFKGSKGTGIDGDLSWIEQPNSKQFAPLTGQLVDRGTMHCRVLEQETGRTVRGARLFLGDGRVFISGADGAIEIGGLPQGNHRTVILADGRERKRVVFDNTLRPNGRLNIYLNKAGRITGVVVDQDGQPVPYAWVKASASGTAMALDGRCSMADADGRFVWEGAAFDRVLRSLSAGHAGYRPDTIRGLSVAADKSAEFVFRLQKEHETTKRNSGVAQPQSPNRPAGLARRDVTGSVVGPDGNPVEDAIIRWGATLYEDVHREVHSESNGRFRLPQIPDRDGYITVIGGKEHSPDFVKIKKGATNISVTLKAGAIVGGRVVTRTGAPVAGVHVVPVIASPDPSLCNPLWISERATHTDNNGRFKIIGLPKTQVLFDFLHDRMSVLRNRPLQIGRTDHTVALGSRGAFRGRVVDPNGKPVRDFRVLIDFPREKRPGDHIASGFDVVVHALGVSFTDEEGRFAFGDEVSPNAVFRVTVASDGYGEAINDRVLTTTVDQLEESEEYLFTMQPSHSLLVRVLEQSVTDERVQPESPIRGAVVNLIDGDPRLDNSAFRWGSDEIGRPKLTTNADGIVRFVELSSGEGTVAVQADGYARTRVGWRNGESEFTVRLVPEASIAGEVRSVEGAPMQNLSISLKGDGQQSNWDTLERDDNGKFQFSNLPGGRYTLALRDERHELLERPFVIEPGDHLRLTFVVDPATGETKLSDEQGADRPPQSK